jgi:hypothetical protein
MPNTAPDPALQQQRRRLAHELLLHLQQLEGPALIVGGLSGSVARGEATPFSDIDVLLFVADDSRLFSRSWLIGGVTVALGVIRAGDLAAGLARPDLRWPKRMGLLAGFEPLVGDFDAAQRWLALGRSIDAQAFRAAVRPHLPELFYESYGRIESCILRGNLDDLRSAAHETVAETALAVCLINRSWVTRDYFGGIRQTFTFSLQPQDWPRLATTVRRSATPAETLAAARELRPSYEAFLALHGYTPEQHTTPATIRLDELP